MKTRGKKQAVCMALLAAAALATVLRLALVQAMMIQFSPGSQYDDLLQIGKAMDIANGEWLGSFDSMTLVKGVGYPLLTALFHRLGLPYIFAYHLLYVLSCVLFVFAVRPLARRGWPLLLVYIFLLFNPIAFSGQLTRLYRDIGYYAVAFIAVSAALGLLVRANRESGSLFFGALTGLSLAFSMSYREDFQWLMIYSAACLLVFLVVRLIRRKDIPIRNSLLAAGLAICLCFSYVLAICGINKAHYGVFAMDDYNSGAFARAYGAILRINNSAQDPQTAIAGEQRALLYTLSPAFAELEPMLDGPDAPFYGWVEVQGEYRTGYFSFVLRDAAARIGKYESAETANAYYEQLAAEINALCDSGAIDAGPPRQGVVARYYPWMAKPISQAAWREALSVLTCGGIDPMPVPTDQDHTYLLIYESFVGGTIAANRYYDSIGVRSNYKAFFGPLYTGRQIATGIIAAYRLLLPAGFVAALALLLLSGIRSLYKKNRHLDSWIGLLAAGSLLLLFLLRCFMLAYVTIGNFNAIGIPSYEAASYPVLLAFIAVTFLLTGRRQPTETATQDAAQSAGA